MTRTADIVVAGAGHNSLITAAYLASAGYEVAMVDARPIPGGGATTEELLLDGMWIDTCSTGHTLIQVNPLIRNDELGLVAKYGLSYIDPDPVEVVAFPDGESLTMWLDLDKTCAEIARFSERDAETYRRLLTEWDEIKALVGATRFRPVGHGPSPQELLAAHPRGGVWTRRSMMSARDIIVHEFESPHVRAFMAWVAVQTAVPIDGAGTGLLAYQIIAGRQVRSWSIPQGGSGRLIDALVGYLTDNGVTIDCNQKVSELILEDGRCVGIRTEAGDEYRARKAVVSTIHVKHLVDMAPHAAWGEDFVYGVDTYHVGVPFFAAYFAATAAPAFTTHDGARSGVSAGVAGWIDDLTRNTRKVSDGHFTDVDPFVLVATPTLADPSRSPEGTHTVKMVTFNAYDPGGGPERWDDIKESHVDRQLEYLRRFAPNFTDDVILGRLVKSPLDIERNNPHMVGGAPHGGDRGITFSGAQRPVPGWAQHRMPIPGLYQTGGTTHPGGSITGAPGRNAAIVMLEDLGRDPAEFMELM
ncbi:MAG TPA: NAD(P)/FAD-dependent oxidoreductase [Acidimicrobiia bacterium]